MLKLVNMDLLKKIQRVNSGVNFGLKDENKKVNRKNLPKINIQNQNDNSGIQSLNFNNINSEEDLNEQINKYLSLFRILYQFIFLICFWIKNNSADNIENSKETNEWLIKGQMLIVEIIVLDIWDIMMMGNLNLLKYIKKIKNNFFFGF